MSSVLQGRTVVLATDRPALAAAFTVSARTVGALVAVGVPDAATVTEVNAADDTGVFAFGVEPADLEAWQRILAAVEQRLGPIDGMVVDADTAAGAALAALASVDMDARRYGAILLLRGVAPADVPRVAAIPPVVDVSDVGLARLAVAALADLLG